MEYENKIMKKKKEMENIIDVVRDKKIPTNCRVDFTHIVFRIKKILFRLCKEHDIELLMFDDGLYDNHTHNRIYVIPEDKPDCCQVIGFEIKTDKGTLELLYIQDNELKRCSIFRTLNELSLWWDMSRVIDWYISDVWDQKMTNLK